MNKLGIDLGGVVIQKSHSEEDTSFFSSNYLNTPPVDYAFETIRALKENRYGDHIYVVSKCGADIEQKSREWLEHTSFYEKCGVSREKIRFCRTRAGKAPICEDLGIECFIDDRTDVLSHMTTVKTRILFAAEQSDDQRFLPAPNWLSVRSILLPD